MSIQTTRISGKRLVIYADGASRGNPGPAALGFVLLNELGQVVSKGAKRIGKATNNQAEYKALIGALEEASRLGAEEVEIRLDSELLVRQVTGIYRVKDTRLKPLFEYTKHLLDGFKAFEIAHIPRQQNLVADSLANAALDGGQSSLAQKGMGQTII